MNQHPSQPIQRTTDSVRPSTPPSQHARRHSPTAHQLPPQTMPPPSVPVHAPGLNLALSTVGLPTLTGDVTIDEHATAAIARLHFYFQTTRHGIHEPSLIIVAKALGALTQHVSPEDFVAAHTHFAATNRPVPKRGNTLGRKRWNLDFANSFISTFTSTTTTPPVRRPPPRPLPPPAPTPTATAAPPPLPAATTPTTPTSPPQPDAREERVSSPRRLARDRSPPRHTSTTTAPPVGLRPHNHYHHLPTPTMLHGPCAPMATTPRCTAPVRL